MRAKLMRMQLQESSRQLLSLSLMVTIAIAFGSGCIFGGKPSPTAAVDDRAIETRISSALSKDYLLRDSPIVVKSAEGIVELTGFVGSTGTKSRAGLVAASTPGVVQVHNDVVVRAAPAP